MRRLLLHTYAVIVGAPKEKQVAYHMAANLVGNLLPKDISPKSTNSKYVDDDEEDENLHAARRHNSDPGKGPEMWSASEEATNIVRAQSDDKFVYKEFSISTKPFLLFESQDYKFSIKMLGVNSVRVPQQDLQYCESKEELSRDDVNLPGIARAYRQSEATVRRSDVVKIEIVDNKIYDMLKCSFVGGLGFAIFQVAKTSYPFINGIAICQILGERWKAMHDSVEASCRESSALYRRYQKEI